MPMIRTVANGQPAFGLYMRQADGTFQPFHLQVLDLDGGRVKHVGAFFDHRLFEKFGLPAELPADYTPRDPRGGSDARPRRASITRSSCSTARSATRARVLADARR